MRFYHAPDANLPEPADIKFWLSLKYALLHGASRALQIERRDIDGVLFPQRGGGTDWRQTIVLYDHVPGGAGHVKRIQEEIKTVVGAALDIVDCECAEDTSCYRCLRDYHNQWEQHLLKRGRVLSFLQALHASLHSLEQALPGVYEVPAVNLPQWLFEPIGRAQQEVVLVAGRVTLASPDPRRSWLDWLHSLLARGVKVRPYLSERPVPRRDDSESLAIAEHLRALLTRGLALSVTKQRAPWQVIIASNTELSRAIQAKTGTFNLDDTAGEGGLVSTTHRGAVREIGASFADDGGQRLDRDALRLPPEITVISTRDLGSRRVSEQELFGELFERPVQRLLINDRSLVDEDRIVNRLGSYIGMAARPGRLESVRVFTYPAGSTRLNTSRVSMEIQNRAIDELKQPYRQVVIDFKRSEQAEHGFIEITPKDAPKARILIGQGLDFMEPEGSVRPTYIVIEDPDGG